MRNDGIADLLDMVADVTPDRVYPHEFAAMVYRVSRSDKGERLSWLKILGGTLQAKMQLEGVDGRGESWAEEDQ